MKRLLNFLRIIQKNSLIYVPGRVIYGTTKKKGAHAYED